jgi:hypothetical protein
VTKSDVQPKPFYPSSDGTNPNDNPGTFDNHYFFINIPKVDDSTTGYPIKNAILALLDLPCSKPQTKLVDQVTFKTKQPDSKYLWNTSESNPHCRFSLHGQKIF